jgi:hypothetical protein
MVEEGEDLQTYRLPGELMGGVFRFPLFKGTSVGKILGNERVEAVDLVRRKDGTAWRIACDTVVVTGRFRPDSVLIDGTGIERDPASRGPVVDMRFRTSVPRIFAAGNVLRGADMHDLCALEGRLAGRRILKVLESGGPECRSGIRIRAQAPIRYVVPQKIIPDQIRHGPIAKLGPCPAFQVARTLRRPVLEAWSGETLLGSEGFRRLIANTRIPLPVERFDWSRVDPEKGVDLKIRSVQGGAWDSSTR